MFLITAAILFLIFTTNVVMGALLGGAFLGDVAEMLVLFASAIAFTAAILRRESDRKKP